MIRQWARDPANVLRLLDAHWLMVVWQTVRPTQTVGRGSEVTPSASDPETPERAARQEAGRPGSCAGGEAHAQRS